MIRKLLAVTYILITFFGLSVFGQQVIHASVLDKGGNPVSSASIALWDIKLNKADSCFNLDAKGTTIIQRETFVGKELRITSIGYNEERITLKDTAYQGFIIHLKEVSKSLKEVAISSHKPLIERKIDKLIFKVENSLSAVGSNAFEVLSKAPAVRTDENSISLVGRGSVGVMINSRIVNLSGNTLNNYLRSISAEEIKEIEIITNPSAKYEATGNSGLINIVLKKNILPGYNGSISTGILVGKYATTGLTGLFNYNVNKLHINTNLTGSIGKNYSYTNGYFDRPEFSSEDLYTNTSNRKGIRGSLSADYDYSKSTAFGVKLEQVDYDIRNRSSRSLTYRSTEIDSLMVTPGAGKEGLTNSSIYLYFQHQLDTSGKKVDFDVSYLDYNNTNRNAFESQLLIPLSPFPKSYQSLKSLNNQGIKIFSSKLDFNNPTKFVNLEFGAKVSFVRANNQLAYYNTSFLPDGQNNAFTYNEQLFSAYLSADKKFKSWDFKIGLRAEYTQTKAQTTSKVPDFEFNYINFFPTVYANYKMDDDRTLGFSYGKRINRPYYDFLNPAVLYLSEYNIEQGNPNLKPSFIHNFEISLNTSKFQTSSYAFLLRNGFSSITLLDPITVVNIQSPLNFIDINKFGLNESYIFDKIGWLESNNEFNIYLEKDYLKSDLAIERSSYVSAYVSTDNTLMLNSKKTLRTNFRFSFQFPERSDLDTRKSFYVLNMGISASLFKRKLTLALNGNDIMKTGYVFSRGMVNNVRRSFEYYTDNRTFRLSVIYRFGTTKNNKSFRDSSREEADRIRN